MKFKFILISLITIGVVIGGNLVKTPKMQKMHKMEEPEPVYRNTVTGGVQYPIVVPNNRNESFSALIDSSNNGYGMVVGSTRPIHVMEDGRIFMVYRQWAGESNLHGRIGATFTDDDFGSLSRYVNINDGDCTGNGSSGCMGRYPSALGTDDFPYAFWNEYSTPPGPPYGGRPLYTFDEFGWGGESFVDPGDVDLTWNSSKDLWVASPGVSMDGSDPIFNVVLNDWTRSNNYFFHSEAVTPDQIIFGSEDNTVFDEANCLEPGDAGGSYNTSPFFSINDDGYGMVGVVGFFAGAVDGNSAISNYHTGIFRLTDDHGSSWSNGGEGDCGYYFIPNEVWGDIIANHFEDWGDGTGQDDPDCEEEPFLVDDMWSYYDLDMKVDANGNPHIVMGGLPGNFAEGTHMFLDQGGWFHFTIDRDFIDSPGDINTPSGWNWSFVTSMGETWSWEAQDADTYAWQTQASLSFSRVDPNVVYIVADKAVTGDITDPSLLDDCNYLTVKGDYPEWSMDILIYRSNDGGSTWAEYNATQTAHDGSNCPLGYVDCRPDEGFPHAAQWTGDDDKVYFFYQMPNWGINLIGDPLPPDHVNRVYGGYFTAGELSVKADNVFPNRFKISNIYPNPFNPNASIQFEVAELSQIKLSIYDLNGRLIKTLVDDALTEGTHLAAWDGNDYNNVPTAAGIYICKLLAGNGVVSSYKLALIK